MHIHFAMEHFGPAPGMPEDTHEDYDFDRRRRRHKRVSRSLLLSIEQAGAEVTRSLSLDNHDDFGGSYRGTMSSR